MPDPVTFNPNLQTLLGQLKGAPKAPNVALPTTDPNPSVAKTAFEAPIDFLMGGLGIKGMGEGDSLASGMGMGAATLMGGPGFYSRLTRAMEGLPNAVSVGKAAAIAKNLASPEEAAARGLPEFLASQGDPATKIPKQAILDHLTGHPLNVEAKTLSTNPQYETRVDPPRNQAEYQQMVDAHEAPQYGQYTLPGGTNYSETLFHLPDHPAQFQSHAHDTPNIVAWSRQNERLTDTGVPVKHIEEIQSDWGQQGKEFGYGAQPPEAKQATRDAYAAAHEALAVKSDEARDAIKPYFGDRPPYNTYSPNGLTLSVGHAAQMAETPEEAANFRRLESELNDAHLRYAEANHRMTTTAQEIPDQPFKGDSWANLPLKQAVWDVANSPDLKGLTLTKPETQIARWPDESNQAGMQQYYGQTYPNQLRKILAPFGGTVEDAAVQLAPTPRNMRFDPMLPSQNHPAGPPNTIAGEVIDNGQAIAHTYPPIDIGNSVIGMERSREVRAQARQLGEQIKAQSRAVPTEPVWGWFPSDEQKAAIVKRGFSLLGLAGLLAQPPPEQKGP